MSYRLRYNGSWTDNFNNRYDVQLFNQNYLGGTNSFKIESGTFEFSQKDNDINQRIRGTKVNLTVKANQAEFRFLYNSGRFDNILIVKRNNVITFAGYYTPDGYFEYETNTLYSIDLIFVDGIAFLKNIFWDGDLGENTESLDVLLLAINQAVNPLVRLGLDAKWYVPDVLNGIENINYRTSFANGKTLYELLEGICKAINLYSHFYNGSLFLRFFYPFPLVAAVDWEYNFFSNSGAVVPSEYQGENLNNKSILPKSIDTKKETGEVNIEFLDSFNNITIEFNIEQENQQMLDVFSVADANFGSIQPFPDDADDPYGSFNVWDMTYYTTPTGFIRKAYNGNLTNRGYGNSAIIVVSDTASTAYDLGPFTGVDRTIAQFNTDLTGDLSFHFKNVITVNETQKWNNKIKIEYACRGGDSLGAEFAAYATLIIKVVTDNDTYFLVKDWVTPFESVWKTQAQIDAYINVSSARVVNANLACKFDLNQTDFQEIEFQELLDEGFVNEANPVLSDEYNVPDLPPLTPGAGQQVVEFYFGFHRNYSQTEDSRRDIIIKKITLENQDLLGDKITDNENFPDEFGSDIVFDNIFYPYDNVRFVDNDINASFSLKNGLFYETELFKLNFPISYTQYKSNLILIAKFLYKLKKIIINSSEELENIDLVVRKDEKYYINYFSKDLITGINEYQLYQYL